MTLDEAIDLEWCLNIEAIATKNQTQIELTQQMHDWLKELRDRRESELRPATRFLSKGWYQQIQHVYSEFNEVITEFHLFDDGDVTEPLKLIEELIDLQMSCETMLACMELNEQQRMEARRRVIAKNKARGYYQEESV